MLIFSAKICRIILLVFTSIGHVQLQECLIWFDSIKDSCLACSDGYYSMNESPFLDVPFPRKECLETIKTKYTLDIFVSENGCSPLSLCDGSKEHPLDNILTALDKISSLSKVYFSSEVRLLLLGREFYILQKDLDAVSKYYFRRYNISIIISPFFCSEEQIAGCLSEDDLIAVNIKSRFFFFFISGRFMIRNIVFRGYDIYFEPSSNCSNSKLICCNPQQLINGALSQDDYPCKVKNSNYSITSNESWGLFNMEYLRRNHDSNLLLPEFNIENCRFEFLNIERQVGITPAFEKLIQSLNENFITISLINVTLSYSFFFDGIINFTGNAIRLPDANLVAKPIVQLKNVSIDKYNFFLLRQHEGALFKIENFNGSLNFTEVDIIELKNSGEYKLTIFMIRNVSDSILVRNFLMLESVNYGLIRGFDFKRLVLDNVIMKSSVFTAVQTKDFFGDFQNAQSILINQTYFTEVLFSCVNSSTFFVFSFKNITENIQIQSIFLENTNSLNFLLEEASASFNSGRIIQSQNDNNYINLKDGSLEIIEFGIFSFKTPVENLFIVNTNPQNSDNKFLIENSFFIDFLFDNVEGYNVMLTWPVSSDSDKLVIRNFSISDCRSNNNKKEVVLFFESYLFNYLEFDRINYSNFIRRRFLFLSLYDFYKLSFTNSIFRNVEENRYYFIAIECRLCDFLFKNIKMDNISFFFDTYFFKVSNGLYENITFTNISKVEYRIFALFWFEGHENCTIRNMDFTSTPISDEFRFYYWETDCFFFLYFLENNFVIIEKTRFIIEDTNLNLRENYIIGSDKNNEFLITDFYSRNIFCRKDFTGSINFENGIVTFLSSHSYIKGADVDSKVTLNLIIIENCENCRNGVIGFLNVLEIHITNLFVKHSLAINGGVLSVLHANLITLNRIYSDHNKASSFGGALYIKGVEVVRLSKSTFSYTEAFIGGTFYFRENIDILIEETTCIGSVSLKDGGSLYSLKNYIQINNGAFISAVAQGVGGGVYVKSGNVTFGNNFLSLMNIAGSGGFIYIEEAANVNMEKIVINESFAFEKGISLLIYECLELKLETVTFIKAGSFIGYGTIYIENQLSNSIYKITEVICVENFALDGNFLLFYSSVILYLANITVINALGPLININSPQSSAEAMNSVMLLNFNIIYQNQRKYLDKWNTLIKIENINATLKDFLFDGPVFDQYSISVSKSLVHFELFTINANRSVTEESLPYFFYLDTTTAVILNIYFAGSLNMGFTHALQSNITLFNINLYRCETLTVACIVTSFSLILVSNSSFVLCKGRNSGVLALSDSTIVLQSSSFMNNIVSNVAESTFTVYDVTFSSLANDIYLLHNAVPSLISNNLFILTEGISLAVSTAPLELQSCLFQKDPKGVQQSSQSKSLWAFDANLTMKRNIFNALFSDLGGALRIESSDFIITTIKENIFINCSSDYGGVFFIRGYVNLTIVENIFLGNKALKYSRQKLGEGGVGVFFCSRCTINEFTLNYNNFTHNSAEYIFPTIFSSSKIFHLMISSESNYFEGNFDGLNFTTALSYFPMSVNLYFTDSKGVPLSDNTNGRIEVVSGSSLDVEVELTDCINQTLSFDNLSDAVLLEIPDKRTTTFIISNPKGSSHSGMVSLNRLKFNANPNNNFSTKIVIQFKSDSFFPFSPEPLSIPDIVIDFFSRPCIIGEIYIDGDQSCFECPLDKYFLVNPMITKPDRQKCLPCPYNSFCPGGSVIIPMPGYWRASVNSTLIVECISKSSCLGDAVALTEQEKVHGACMIHHFGPLCYLCENGYARLSTKDVCKLCKDNPFMYVKFIFASFLIFAYILFQVRLTFRSTKSSYTGILLKLLVNHFQQIGMISLVDLGWTVGIKNYFALQEIFSFLSEELFPLDCLIKDLDFNLLSKRIIISNVMPIILSLIALILWFSAFSFKITFTSKYANVQKVFDQIRVSSLIIIYLLYPEIIRKCFNLLNCMLIDDSVETKVLTLSPETECWTSGHYFLLLIAALPGLVTWGLLTPLFIWYLLKKNKVFIVANIKGTKPPREIKDQNHRNTLTSISAISRNSVAPGNLIQIWPSKNSLSRRKNFFPMGVLQENSMTGFLSKIDEQPGLMNEVEERKNDNQLKKAPDSLLDFQQISKVMEKEEDEVEEFDYFTEKKDEPKKKGIMLRFLYKGYRKKYFYWELIMFSRKFLLIMIGSLTDLFPSSTKATFLLVILSFYLLIHTRNEPFETVFLNRAEFFSLIVVFFTANIGIMLFTEDLKKLDVMFLTLVILVNLVFIFVWGAIFWTYIIKKSNILKAVTTLFGKSNSSRKSQVQNTRMSFNGKSNSSRKSQVQNARMSFNGKSRNSKAGLSYSRLQISPVGLSVNPTVQPDSIINMNLN